jgi:hypothetical protein
MKLLEAKIEGLALDVTTNTPVVVLAPDTIEKVLPIWIGHAEAWAIAMELSGVPANRPMTHDLLKHVLIALNATVTRVEITELKEQTFYAVIHIVADGKEQTIDARPSDSLALALKTGARIFVNEELFSIREQESESQDAPPQMPTDPETLRERLRKINPEDFGKYSL